MKRLYKKRNIKDRAPQLKIIFLKKETRDKIKKLSLKNKEYQYEVVERAINLMLKHKE